MNTQYRKKPVVIGAVQWNGLNVGEMSAHMNVPSSDIKIKDGEESFEIATLEGVMTASKGDFIIRGVQGEFYPCKPDIFYKTYDHANNENLSFGAAIELLKQGAKIARTGWNGKGMFVYYVTANKYPASGNALKTMEGMYENDMVPYLAYMAIKTADGTVGTWAPSNSDTLAEDWLIVE